VQRACGTSLTTTVQLAQRIARGEIEVAIAGGVDTTSEPGGLRRSSTASCSRARAPAPGRPNLAVAGIAPA
jgi:acetyl-CoA acetyltransferase